MHDAIISSAVDKPEGVPQFVDDLLDQTLFKQGLVLGHSVETFVKAKGRNDGGCAIQLGLSEDICQDGHKQVAAGDCENLSLMAGKRVEKGGEKKR